MTTPIPLPAQYPSLIADIEKGLLKIPQFQRDFVWTIEQTAKLLDSIMKGFPIGSFIFWETDEQLRSVRNIGNMQIPATPPGFMVNYILDGQQRMTSLFAALKGATINQDGKVVDYSKIYVNLEACDDDAIVITDCTNINPEALIPFTKLLEGSFMLTTEYPNHIPQLQKYSDAVKLYSFSTIRVKNATIDIATDIFTRLNVGGKSLTMFEIMVAKTYDHDLKFDLSERFDALIERLETVNYETISSSIIMQIISLCICKECAKKHILKLDKYEIIKIWDDVIDAFELAVDYFRSFYRIPVSQLLPYDSLLIPFTYFFYKNKTKPTGKVQDFLQDYFWRTVLTSRFSSGTEAKLAHDVRNIDLILENKIPNFDISVNITATFLLDNGWFSTGSAFIKGLLCILAYQQPVSLVDGSIVNINNDWLKAANSKNYHHFFPRAFLRKKGFDESIINHIGNITIVDDFLNKRIIKDRAPSDYINEFKGKNQNLNNALNTHLIGDPSTVGIDNDDYEVFLNTRINKLCEELKNRLILTNKDYF